ncbi:two-component system, OmpR family, osmolarity sensor histidine kinase EnvZ [Novosphingobium sp. CF614]|uniref:ATP-binding protein n=1 Tax=Novosphingobium sp. CF614 TaxID=1884364 RepID=UPI0008E3CDCE|nr:ATP-binding protein [Novosphingobium sp. CF614]SFF98755.1 two-component system, OmpR family, osmolarity sensor histidine kinase EnvZ [Novosphingobium sp. CF614]
MLKSLLHRNVALMIGVVLAGQMIAGLLVMTFVMRPQIDRVANVTADMIAGLSQVMADMPAERRTALIRQIEAGGDLAIREGDAAPTGRARFPNFIERQFIRSLTERLAAHEELSWRTGDGNRLWFRLKLGGRSYWISVTPPTRRGALASMVYASIAAIIVSLACGLLLQRRLDAPLRKLAAQVDAYGLHGPVGGAAAPLDTSGPDEVAAVASAFNRMAERLAREEAERSLMLGGVSHDLRTPLTRLRLCLEMMRGADAELEAIAVRQVDRIEAMLEQFLDFARGFEDEHVVPCDVAEMLVSLVRDHDPEGAITVEVPAGLRAPLRVRAVSRAVGNLIGNALRHGIPPVVVTARRDGAMLEIVVSDAGAGFDAQAAAQLTRPFARGNSARSGDGAGLGLAIAERVAAAHAGTLAFDKRDGRFRAVLRLAV